MTKQSLRSVQRCFPRAASPRAINLLAAAPFIFGISSAALAAEGSAPVLEEIVVTAQFRSERLQDTPIAITAVNAEMLEQRSQNSIEQVAAQAPNVTLTPNGAGFGSSLQASIRGVGQTDFNPALEPGVGMYVDDVYYSTLTGSIFDLLDLDRVEILRGPQGTLTGKNSIGGAIRLYSKKPDGKGGGYLEATYGSYSRVDLRGSADFALVDDKLFLRVAGVTRNRKGYVDRIDYACAHPGEANLPPTIVQAGSCKIGSEGGKSMGAIRAALRWLPTDDLEVNVVYDVTDDRSEPQPATLLVALPPNNPRYIPSDPFVSYSTRFDPGDPSVGRPPFLLPDENSFYGWGASGTVDWKLADKLALKSISSYREYENVFGDDQDISPLPIATGQDRLTHYQFNQELRLNGSISDAFDYTVGGFYFTQRSIYGVHQDLVYVQSPPPAPRGPGLNFLGNDPIVAKTYAGFLHGVFHVTDKLDLTGGYRYTKDKKDYTFFRNNLDGTPHPLLGGLNNKVGAFEGTRSDYRANIDYKWTDDFMTYLQYSTGFKGGGINPRPFFVGQVQPFQPETLKAGEVGFKSALWERRIRLNFAAFYNKYKDIQLTVLSCDQFSPFPGAPCALPVNGGDANVKGAELEFELHPTEALSIDASASYLDFQYTRIDPSVGDPVSGRGVQIGMVTPFTPKIKWSAGIQYQIPVGEGSLTPRVDASYTDSTYSNAVNGPGNQTDSYTMVNARLTWRAPEDTWQASAEVTNLTDKLIYYAKFDATTLGTGTAQGYPAMPRAWAITLKRNFK